MSKSKFHTAFGIRIYPIEYLMNEEFTESDLSYLLDTKSLVYSIVIGMFREIGSKKQNRSIIKLINTNNKWIYDNRWSSNQFIDFECKLVKIFKNLYCVNDSITVSKAQWFMIKYGLSVKDNNVSFE